MTWILPMKKGTIRHKQVGYAYVISMTVLIITAFMLYHLFNGWGIFGIFHYAAIVSLVMLIFGMVPIWVKKPVNTWKYWHFSFMYWSVMGLYGAFVAEGLVRIPKTPFFGIVGVSVGIVMTVGGIFYWLKKSKSEKIFL